MKGLPERHPDRGKPFKNMVSMGLRLLFGAANKLVYTETFNPESLEIVEIPLRLPHLDRAFDGYRVLQISDIHMGTWMTRERLEEVVELVNRQNPDLIAITGDFVTYFSDRPLYDLILPLRNLKPKDVTLAVLGNHDQWTDPGKVRTALEDCNIIEIGNDVYTLRRGSASLHFGGMDDVYGGRGRLDLVLDRLPEEGAAILLAHEPDFADRSAATGRFDLQLSGHSHGGQVVLPWIGPPFLPPLARKYRSGRYQVNGMVQYTNRGLGTSHLQLRYNCPGEVTIFTLKSGMKE